MTKLGDVTLIKDCMICHREVILMARINTTKELPEKGTILPKVCEECREKYLTKGTLLINPDNGNLIVLKDEAFKQIFDCPIPEQKIAFTEQDVLDRLSIPPNPE